MSEEQQTVRGPGRRREEAPEGYATVREAAELLGVTRQAIRQRIDRGTLPTMTQATEGGGEQRYYVPWEALRDAKRRQGTEEDPRPGGPLRITVHRPELPQTVRIETGPWGTDVHIDG